MRSSQTMGSGWLPVLSPCALTRLKKYPASVTSCCCYNAWDVAHRQLLDTPCSVSKLAAAITPAEVKSTRFLFFLRLHPSSVAVLTTGDDSNAVPPSITSTYITHSSSSAMHGCRTPLHHCRSSLTQSYALSSMSFCNIPSSLLLQKKHQAPASPRTAAANA